MQRRETAKLGGPRQTSSRGFASNFGSQYQSVRTSSPDMTATTHYDNYKADTAKRYAIVRDGSDVSAPSGLKAKGMSLGKKANTRLYDALSDEIVATEETARLGSMPHTPVESSTTPLAASSSEGINISFTENTTARCNRDGGIDSLDVQGQLNLHISDSSLSRIQIGLDIHDADGTQYKTHPNVDRNLFKDKQTIGLRDSSRPFPLNQQMSVLRWRSQDKSAALPISGMWSVIQAKCQSIIGLLLLAMELLMSILSMN
jgi:coatomer subunit delta